MTAGGRSDDRSPSARHDFEAIGTHFSISTDTELDDDTISALHQRAEAFDQAYSRFRADSIVAGLAAEGGSVRFPDDAAPMLAFYRRLYDVTDHRVTPLVGNVLEHLGYDATYSLMPRDGVARAPEWDDVLTVNGSTLTASAPVVLDLGAAGKGHLADLLAEILVQQGFSSYLVDASGDLRHAGTTPCVVGLEHPDDPTKVIGVANLLGRALCGSATNRRRWGADLHHIVDPQTGMPTTSVTATWAVADTAMVADGLSTALFFTDPAVLADHFDFSFVRVLSGGRVEYSNNFDGELFR